VSVGELPLHSNVKFMTVLLVEMKRLNDGRFNPETAVRRSSQRNETATWIQKP
jgi:hypothetical protein